jgi:hypothetical protein
MEQQLVEKKEDKRQSAFRFAKLNTILESFADEQGSFKLRYGNTTVTIRLVRYTPDLAEKILEDYNSKNRKINKNNVGFIIREIQNSNWLPNGDTITFDVDGNLADGQHRLLAIINTGVPLEYITITGLDPEAFKTIDIGSQRSGSDALSIEGISNSTHISAMLKFIYAFKIGKYSQNKHHHRTLSNSSLIDYYYDLTEDKVYDSYKFYNSVKSASVGFLTPSIISGFHFLMSEINEEQANDFLGKLCNGIGLEPDSPITALRNKIWKSKIDKNYKLSNQELLANIVYAWNKYRNGKKAKTLKLPNEFEMVLK